MKKYLSVFSITIILLFLVSSTGFALNITISDKNIGGSDWHDGTNEGNEDQEVEPGMQHGQNWDLEAFLLEGTELSIVSGYDLQNGFGGYAPGHIFIDVDDGAVFGDIHGTAGDGNKTVKNSFGYDYVIIPTFSSTSTSKEYQVYSIDDTSDVITAYYSQNQGSSPWQYEPKISESSIASGSFDYQADNSVNFEGTTHYVMSGIDLGFIAGQKFTAHYTMQCGNDNLMGQGTVPTPEPSSVILLGLGVCAFFGYRKRQAGLMK